MSYENMKFVGSKFDKKKDIKDISKEVKQYLEKFEGYKFSVRIQRYSGGQSLSVDIKGIPENVDLYNSDFIEWLRNGQNFRNPTIKYSKTISDLLKEIKLYVNSYNFDDSDSVTDYFHVNFYSHIEVHWEYDFAEQKKIKGN